MALDEWIRVGMFLIAVVGAGKILIDLYSGRIGRAREDYRFAKEFFKDLEGGLHPFVKEKGFQTLSGNSRLTHDEGSYLIGLKKPVQALKDYSLGRDYIELSTAGGGELISFKKKYANVWARRWRKALYSALYFAFGMAAFSPLIFLREFSRVYPPFMSFLIFLVVLGIPAVNFMKMAVKIYRAEQLEANQVGHTGVILRSRK